MGPDHPRAIAGFLNPRMLALVRSGRAPVDRIVAITSSEKGAGELKLRLREEIESALAQAEGDEAQARSRMIPGRCPRTSRTSCVLSPAPV